MPLLLKVTPVLHEWGRACITGTDSSALSLACCWRYVMANAPYSARGETDVQHPGKYITSKAGEGKKLPEQFSCQRHWAKLMTNNSDG